MASILIIDDELDFLRAMQKALVKASHDVKVVSDARVVIEGEVGTDFDLVVTDMIMPGADGLEVLAYLYRANPEIKIVAISGGGYFGSDFYLNLAAKFGAMTTLEKPFLLSELVNAVDVILNDGQSGSSSDDSGPADGPSASTGLDGQNSHQSKVVDLNSHKNRRQERTIAGEALDLLDNHAVSVLTAAPGLLKPRFH